MIDPFIDAEVDNHSAQVIQVESSKLLPLIVILALISGCAISLAVYAMVRATDAVTEARLLEYYVNGLQGTLVTNGLINPGDDYSKFKSQHTKPSK